ncbi:hypothetical protein ACJX0J_024024, partial [Zea mays]
TLPGADQLTFQFCFLFLFWILEYIPKCIYRNLEITGGFDILNLLLIMRVGLDEPQPAEGIQT